jgi:four helix bundle protein
MNISFRDLTVYKKAFLLAMEIFEIIKKFPSEEKFGLTSQIRNSSRSVCPGIAEAYRKRQYQAYFISKTSDSDMENSETQVWLDFSLRCKYIDSKLYKNLLAQSEEVGRLLYYMIEYPEKYLRKTDKF